MYKDSDNNRYYNEKDFIKKNKDLNIVQKLCKPIYIRLGDLDWSKFNREKMNKHVETLGESIIKHGMLKSIPVLPFNKQGKRTAIDVNHGSSALVDCIGLPPDTLVAASEVYWVDPDDKFEVQLAIMVLNDKVKTWPLAQTVRSLSMTFGGIYETMRLNILKYRKSLTSATVVNCYCVSNLRKETDFKLGKFKKYWEKNSMDWKHEFVDKILKKLSEFVTDHNTPGAKKRKVDAEWTRELTARLMADAEVDKNMTRWIYMLNASFVCAGAIINSDDFTGMPIQEKSFNGYWDNVKKTANALKIANVAA